MQPFNAVGTFYLFIFGESSDVGTWPMLISIYVHVKKNYYISVVKNW